MQGSTAVILLNFCGENPPHRQAEKRYGSYFNIIAFQMNIAEKEAKKFIAKLYSDGRVFRIDNTKILLNEKLSNFYRDKDRLDFLKILRQETVKQQNEHLKTCPEPDCQFMENRNIGLFLVDQEIDLINDRYTYVPRPEDRFSPEEESELQERLNDITNKLIADGLGQEVIFEEIESLKEHFKLGKKTWFQLVKGKLMDLTFEKVLEVTVVSQILKYLSKGYHDFVKLLP